MVDVFELLEDLHDYNDWARRQNNPRVFRQRVDSTEVLSDTEFKRHFRFDKQSVKVIAEMLHEDLAQPNNRGRPLSPLQQVCIALNHYAGGYFQRISAMCVGVSQTAAWWAIKRVTYVLCDCKAQFIRMPSVQQMAETAQRMLDRFQLPRQGSTFVRKSFSLPTPPEISVVDQHYFSQIQIWL
jgi:hypothetical protein